MEPARFLRGFLMTSGILEVAKDKRHLSLYRGFVKISSSGDEIGRVPLANLEAVMLTGHGITLSKNLLAEFAHQKIITIVCGPNYQPVSLCIPASGHYQSAGILWDQIESSEPLKKRLWQSIIKAKIANQTAVLAQLKPDHNRLKRLQYMAQHVKSGDPENLEAQAARLYWPALLGKSFRRDTNGGGINSLLNYCYAVLRSSVARSLSAAGLHPALGVHHKNRNNAFCLADDLIEPYRPFADFLVSRLLKTLEGKIDELTPEIKRQLAGVLELYVQGQRGLTPIGNAIGASAISLRDSFTSKKNEIWLPDFEMEFLEHDTRSENLGERV